MMPSCLVMLYQFYVVLVVGKSSVLTLTSHTPFFLHVTLPATVLYCGYATELVLCCCLQGFASGDLEKDATAVRMFTDAGVELLLSQVCILAS